MAISIWLLQFYVIFILLHLTMTLFIIKSNWPSFLNSKESRDGNVLRFILQLECNFSLVILLSLVMRKPAFCICENKAADQLRSNCAADQHLYFRYMDSAIPLLSISELSSLQPSSMTVQPGCVGLGRKPRRPVFSQRGSFDTNCSNCFIIRHSDNKKEKLAQRIEIR